MKTTRKIFVALVLTLVVAAVLSVCAFAAYNLDLDLPKGAVKGDAKWIDSGYSDIDAEGSGYTMIGGPADYSGTTTSWPTIATLNFGRFYWNKTTDKGVFVVTGNEMSAAQKEWEAASSEPQSKTKYAYAAHFVDITLGYSKNIPNTYKALADETLPLDTEASQNVRGSNLDRYNIYVRYIDSGKASKVWSHFYVTKASYDAYMAYKAELDTANTLTGTDYEDALVQYVYDNFAGYKMATNVKEGGANVTLTWFFMELTGDYVFDTIEFRTAQENVVFSTYGYALRAVPTKSILFDSKINTLGFTSTWQGLFYDLWDIWNNFKTFDHVTFAADGSHEAVTENVVDLRGFKTTHTHLDKGHFTYLIYGPEAVSEVIWFDSITADGVEKAGLIDEVALKGCAGLNKITLNSPLTEIRQSAFDGCTALKTIDLLGGVAADVVIDPTAFNGVSGAVAVVYTSASKANLEAALATAGIDSSVVTVEVRVPAVLADVISSDGFSIRLKNPKNGTSGPALRAEFTLVDSLKAAAETAGFTFADYGVIVFSANTANSATYNGNVDLILADAVAGKDTTKLKMVSAMEGPKVKYHENGDITFAVAVTSIPEVNYMSEVYSYAYTKWTKGAEEIYVYTTYTSDRTGKTAHSLYDMTVFAFRNGIANSQNTDADKLWPILEKGAFSVTAEETKAPSSSLALTMGYSYDATGKFTYLDQPLRAWNLYKKADGSLVYNSSGTSVEATATTGILWSILVDGDDLIAVYRADPDAETSVIPELRDNYGASAPYSSNYFLPVTVTEDPAANGLLKTATIYSPILTDENAKKVVTLVIDYGVDVFSRQAIDDSKSSNSINTVVYPEGMRAGAYMLRGSRGLKNFIYATEDKSYLADYNVGSLVDLSGFNSICDTGIVYEAYSVKNILLPTAEKIVNNSANVDTAAADGFAFGSGVERVWTVGYEMPSAGTLDLSNTSIERVSMGYFNSLNNIYNVIMPMCFDSIDSYCLDFEWAQNKNQRWFLFGNNSTSSKLNIEVKNEAAFNAIVVSFYEARQNYKYNDKKEGDPNGIAHVVDYLKVTYNGQTKTVLEWRATLAEQ